MQKQQKQQQDTKLCSRTQGFQAYAAHKETTRVWVAKHVLPVTRGGRGVQVETAKNAMQKKKEKNAFAPPPLVKMVHVIQIFPWIATIKGN